MSDVKLNISNLKKVINVYLDEPEIAKQHDNLLNVIRDMEMSGDSQDKIKVLDETLGLLGIMLDVAQD